MPYIIKTVPSRALKIKRRIVKRRVEQYEEEQARRIDEYNQMILNQVTDQWRAENGFGGPS
jgi:hypothetical protein